jgi:hypothetical protein
VQDAPRGWLRQLECLVSEIRRQKRAMLARISSAVLTPTKGLGRWFQVPIHSRMSASRASSERGVPRRMRLVVSLENQRSTLFIQLALVGVK